ncbi:MAG: DAK2 domain-containing protein [Chloroflexi bacterium]|nr:DAK2 domain-containing protein [Chloroflexota bacterium]
MTAFASVLVRVADDVVAAQAELNQLDGAAGDGDLGLTMSTGARALIAIAPELEAMDLASAVRRCGSELARKAPSTSGTLVATALLRAAGVLGGDKGSAALVAEALAASRTGIEQRGKASVGDKTMLDALAPACEAAQASAEAGLSVCETLRAAARAAADGAALTKSMRAKVGRAGWLADRSEGHEDAGAHLVALLLASAARHACEGTATP